MRVSTVTLRQKSTGKIKTVNQNEYATDLGRAQFAGWELLREDHNDDSRATIEPVTLVAEEVEEVEAVEEDIIEDAASDEPEEDPIDYEDEDDDTYN